MKAYPAMVVGVLLGTLTSADPITSPVVTENAVITRSTPDDGRGTDYIVDKTDNICGLDTPRQLNNPAVVDYDAVLDATPEVRKMKKENIPEDSARGIQLRSAAEARARKACQKIMGAKGNCSVWKEIKRRDGKQLPDITDEVKSEL